MTPLFTLWLAGCQRKVSCEQVTTAVAARVWGCTQDSDLAWGRALRLRQELGCAEEDEDRRTAPAACHEEIDALSCAEVERIGDDPGGWIDRAPSCAAAFAGDGGTGPARDTAPPTPPTPTGDTGGPPPVPDCALGGPYGCALAIGAKGDHAKGAMPPTFGALTLEARVRNIATPAQAPTGFVGFGQGVCTEGSLAALADQAAVLSDVVVLGGIDVMSDRGWHTVAAVWDGGSWTVIADGVPSAPSISCATDLQPGSPLSVGQLHTGPSALVGEIDEVRIWGRALAPSEIGAPVVGAEPDLIAWYPFDDANAEGRVPNAASTGSAWDLVLEGGARYVLVP